MVRRWRITDQNRVIFNWNVLAKDEKTAEKWGNAAQRQWRIYLWSANRLLLSKFVVSHNCTVFSAGIFLISSSGILPLYCARIAKYCEQVYSSREQEICCCMQKRVRMRVEKNLRMGKWLMAHYFVSSISLYTKIWVFTWRCGFETLLKIAQNSDFFVGWCIIFMKTSVFSICLFAQRNIAAFLRVCNPRYTKSTDQTNKPSTAA